MASLLREMGEYDEARRLFEEVGPFLQLAFSLTHPVAGPLAITPTR